MELKLLSAACDGHDGSRINCTVMELKYLNLF